MRHTVIIFAGARLGSSEQSTHVSKHCSAAAVSTRSRTPGGGRGVTGDRRPSCTARHGCIQSVAATHSCSSTYTALDLATLIARETFNDKHTRGVHLLHGMAPGRCGWTKSSEPLGARHPPAPRPPGPAWASSQTLSRTACLSAANTHGRTYQHGNNKLQFEL